MADTGEQVKWHNLELVELEDMVAVSELQASNLSRALSPLLDNHADGTAGYPTRGGLLSALSYDGTDPQHVTFGPMTICRGLNGSGGVTDHGPTAVFRYDLSSEPQASMSTQELDFQGRTRPFVWALRHEVDSGPSAPSETRVFWDELSETEETQEVVTRVREVVELALSHASNDALPPTSDPEWVPIARVVSIGSEVVLAPRHVFDGYDPVVEASATNEERAKGIRFYPSEPEIDTVRRPSLAESSRLTTAVLAKIHDGRWALNTHGRLAGTPEAGLRSWRHALTDPTFRGLKQLQEELDVLNARPKPVFIGRFEWSGSAYTLTTVYIETGFFDGSGFSILGQGAQGAGHSVSFGGTSSGAGVSFCALSLEARGRVVDEDATTMRIPAKSLVPDTLPGTVLLATAYLQDGNGTVVDDTFDVIVYGKRDS